MLLHTPKYLTLFHTSKFSRSNLLTLISHSCQIRSAYVTTIHRHKNSYRSDCSWWKIRCWDEKQPFLHTNRTQKKHTKWRRSNISTPNRKLQNQEVISVPVRVGSIHRHGLSCVSNGIERWQDTWILRSGWQRAWTINGGQETLKASNFVTVLQPHNSAFCGA